MKVAITPAYGPAEILEVQEVPKPRAEADQVLIEVHASPVTEGDRRIRSADFPGMTALFGRLALGILGPRNRVQGTMFAGRVVSVGPDVTAYAVGDDVFGSVDSGAYAEFISVPQSGNMTKIPVGVSYAEAAATPYGAVTALIFLRDLANVKPGDKVLILGASGGVGRYAVELAKHYGAEVTGVASTRNIDLVRELGADHVIDYTTEDFTQNGETYDVIFDIADASSFSHSRSSLTKTGRYLTLYISLRVMFQIFVTSLFGKKRAKFTIAMGSRDDMNDIAELLTSGVIRPIVAKRFPFEQIADAHAAVDAGLSHGSVVISMPPIATVQKAQAVFSILAMFG